MTENPSAGTRDPGARQQVSRLSDKTSVAANSENFAPRQVRLTRAIAMPEADDAQGDAS
jgi:hypothetical protein